MLEQNFAQEFGNIKAEDEDDKKAEKKKTAVKPSKEEEPVKNEVKPPSAVVSVDQILQMKGVETPLPVLTPEKKTKPKVPAPHVAPDPAIKDKIEEVSFVCLLKGVYLYLGNERRKISLVDIFWRRKGSKRTSKCQNRSLESRALFYQSDVCRLKSAQQRIHLYNLKNRRYQR